MRSLAYTLVLVLLLALGTQGAKKTEDPKDCEVCVEVLEGVDKLIPSDEKSSKTSIEEAVDKYCKGDLSPKQKKMCYYITPIKKSVSQPFSLKLPKKKVCQRLKKDNPEICEVKNTVKVEKTASKEDVTKLRVKQLKSILADRGVTCDGCLEKEDYVKRVMETAHM